MNFLFRTLLPFAASLAFAVEAWNDFPRTDAFYSADLMDGTLVLGTDGGVRFIDGDGGSDVFSSEDGLEASEIYAVAKSENDVLFAVSSKGIVSRYAGNGKFQVENRSFVSEGVELVPGLVRNAADILVLGFKDRISFFDVEKRKSLITLTRIGDVSLKALSPSAIEIRGDSLMVAVGNAVYFRQMDWIALERDVLLADPNSWTLAAQFQSPDSSRSAVRKISVSGDSLLADFNETVTPIVALGDTLSPKRFPSLWNGDSSKIRQILEAGDFAYLVGKDSVWRYDGELENISAWSKFPLSGAYVAFTGHPDGGVSVHTSDGEFGFSDGESWALTGAFGDLPYYAEDAPHSRLLKNLAVLSDGTALVSVWGFGFRLFGAYGSEWRADLNSSSEFCAERYLPDFIVGTGVDVAPDSVGWFVSYWGNSGYGIAYVDAAGNASCANGIGSGNFSGPLRAVASADGSEWIVYSAVGMTEGVSGHGALDIFRFKPISETGGELSLSGKDKVPTPDNYTLVDLDFDKSGRLWAVTNSTVAYWEEGMDSVQAPHKVSSFEQASLSSVAVDPKDRLWVGTVGSGAYRIQKTASSPDTMAATRYASRNGLLNDIVYDVAVDSKKGEVWFIHRNGASRYFRADLRETSSFMTSDGPEFKLYPNPVRFDLGQVLTFDYFPEAATVSIYNAGAHLVRSFRNDEVSGGRLVWDGRGKDGTLVAPGVYHYIVKKGSQKKRGKILVIH